MKYVLFVCNHNAGRSQMAQAFFERDAPSDIRAESAGPDPVPVRSHVMTIAHRQTRDCLRAERCHELDRAS